MKIGNYERNFFFIKQEFMWIKRVFKIFNIRIRIFKIKEYSKFHTFSVS